MNLKTTYMGIELPNPIVAGASPMTDNVDTVKHLEDAGASMICMPSLFEEQILQDQLQTQMAFDSTSESFAEALTYMPSPEDFRTGPDAYLERVAQLKKAVSIPIVGSLNGSSAGGWLNYAKLIEQAGADALELNVYDLPTDPTITGAQIEERTLAMVKQVCSTLDIPVAVKLSPFYSSLANLSQQLVQAGASGLVIFNRFYQADIDVEELYAVPYAMLSDSGELLLRLRWIAILSSQVNATIAATGGIHTSMDIVKAIMSGASVTQLVSALLQLGPHYIKTLLTNLEQWLEEHEYESLA
ncbi:dihydroorotate dehydrogenase-like protein, partial [bacterium AH-315-I18]|nr:dihydroorotate dehydrogenase-like protein [bacterium AH-315-I18]